jgi:cytochrome P450
VNVDQLIENFDARDPAFGEDGSLEAVMAELRERCPVAHTDAHGGAYVLTRYEDVSKVAQNWEEFSNTGGTGLERADNAVALIPGDCDPPLQTHYRRALNPLLTQTAVERYEPGMRSVARELLGRITQLDRVDIVPAFTDPYPRLVFFRHVIGVPVEELDEALGYIYAIKEPKSMEEASRAWVGFTDFLTRICARRQREQPRGDLLDGVLHAEIDGRPISRDEAVPALMMLTFGGLGTTSSALANIIRRLGEQTELQDRLSSDPGLLSQAIEEFLRFDTVATVLARTTTCDVRVSECTIPAKERVLLYFAGANRDCREFEKPDEIQIDRNPNRHLSFGIGPHRCIGSNLARQQIRVALEEVLARLKNIRVVPDSKLTYHSGQNRALHALPITFTAWTGR